MFDVVKLILESAKIAFKLGKVTKQYPTKNFAYATWNATHTRVYALVDGKLLFKEAADVDLLELFPIYGELEDYYLVNKSTILVK